MTPDLSAEQVKAMKDAIENNQQDSPTLTIDPQSKTTAVVGDPNNLHPTSGNYTITFEYRPDEVAEADKPFLTYVQETNKYIVKVDYKNCRVKPLYRTKIVSLLLNIMVDLEVVKNDGTYTAEAITTQAGEILLNHTKEILEIAVLVLGEKKERLEHAQELVSFLTALVDNEPNILNEVGNFLESLPGAQRLATATPQASPSSTQS